jgi:chemotaxis protein CheZ
VLDIVDLARVEQANIAVRTRELAQLIATDPVQAFASRSVERFVDDVEAATLRTEQHLSAIMLAQDFHDLTSQVMCKVVQLATDLEDQLLKLLLQSAAAQPPFPTPTSAARPTGPVIDPNGRPDIVTSQEQVDDLLASLGF